MKTTTVDVGELAERLKTNRAKHEKEFRAAKKVWVKKAAKALAKAAKKAKKTGWIDQDPVRSLPMPQHYLRSYDRMLSRLDAEVNPTVELDEREFASYWDDDWEWHNAFVGTNTLYNS